MPDRLQTMLRLAKVWAYPLWWGVRRAGVADIVEYDVSRWVRCIGNDDLIQLGKYARFAFLVGALTEFRTLVNYRLRPAPVPLRVLLRAVYRGERTLMLDAKSIGPGLFIQHGVASQITAERIGRDCWINQQVTVGYSKAGRPNIGDNVTIAAGAVVIGPITVHDGATIGANATVVHDVPAGQTLVAPVARPLRETTVEDNPDAI